MEGKSMQWDPSVYLRYGDERGRPFVDLMARVGADSPAAVYDLGCGPGNFTALLAQRWPKGRVVGIDSSTEMIDQAAKLARPGRLEFVVADLREFVPGPDADVVVSNATLHWVSGHAELLGSWAAAMAPGSWLAFQVPGNFDAPSHVQLREVAEDPLWSRRLAGLLRRPVGAAADYARLLANVGCLVDAWETTYLHALAAPDDGVHPVLAWMEGTALRPVHAALPDAQWREFRTRLQRRLAHAYPVDHGTVWFEFRRIFVVAQPGRSDAPEAATALG